MNSQYKGVTITIEPGNTRTNRSGYFTLSWPGHDPERIQSIYKQTEFILIQAQEFIDTWLTDGYIQLASSVTNAP